MGTKTSDLTALAGASIALTDLVAIVDVSDTTQAASGTTKRTSIDDLRAALRLLGMPTPVLSTAQVTNNSTASWTDVTGCSIAVTAGRTYHVKVSGLYQSAVTTTGLNLRFTGPALTQSALRSSVRQAANGTDSFFEVGSATLLTFATSASVVAANTDYPFFIEGHIKPSASGTLQLQCMTEVNASQITVQTGVCMVVTDCG